MTISDPVVNTPAAWQPPAPRMPPAYQAQPPAPVDWSALPGYPPPRPAATGFDRHLKIGTVLLLVSLVAFPIVFGPWAAYYGHRSNKAGNPAGAYFAIGSIVVTVLNIAITLMILLPRLLN